MILPEFLTQDSDGDIRFTNHRIGLYHVIDRYHEGYSAEMLAEEFPTLSLALIHRTLAYYLENRAEVDAYVNAYREDLDRLAAASEPGPAAVEVRRRLEARHGREINQADRE